MEEGSKKKKLWFVEIRLTGVFERMEKK